MKLYLNRPKKNKRFQTLGLLLIDGVQIGVTLELPWIDNLPFKSCIPKGKYKIRIRWSTKFNCKVIEVEGVPGRYGILFHQGNFVKQIKGCILSGFGYKDLDSDGHLDVTNSVDMLKELIRLVELNEIKELVVI